MATPAAGRSGATISLGDWRDRHQSTVTETRHNVRVFLRDRLALLVLVLLGVSVITFAISHLIPTDPARLIAAREAVPVVNAWVGADEVLYVVMEDGTEYSQPLDLEDGRGWVEGGRDLDGDGVVEVFVVMPLVGAAYESPVVYTVKDEGLHFAAELAESGNSYNRDSGLECRRLPEGGDEIRAWGAEGWSEPFWSFSGSMASDMRLMSIFLNSCCLVRKSPKVEMMSKAFRRLFIWK